MKCSPVAAEPAADATIEAVGEAGGVLVQALDQPQKVGLGDAAGCRSHSASAVERLGQRATIGGKHHVLQELNSTP